MKLTARGWLGGISRRENAKLTARLEILHVRVHGVLPLSHTLHSFGHLSARHRNVLSTGDARKGVFGQHEPLLVFCCWRRFKGDNYNFKIDIERQLRVNDKLELMNFEFAKLQRPY